MAEQQLSKLGVRAFLLQARQKTALTGSHVYNPLPMGLAGISQHVTASKCLEREAHSKASQG